MSNYENLCNLENVFIAYPNHQTDQLISKECLKFLALLHRTFNFNRKSLLKERLEKQKQLDKGLKLDFPFETEAIRNGNWKVAPIPEQLQKRWIEITGPPTKKGTVNALNSGADCFMADFEDALAPTWQNLLEGQESILLANKKQLNFKHKNKEYKLKENIGTLIVRPRGWHLDEKHLIIDGEPISGSLFDFGVYFFNNYKVRQENGLGGIFYYLPKLESYIEARLWNDVFLQTEQYFGVEIGHIRCTVLIETIGGALDMDEILYELRQHIVALNAGRWDYLFSLIKKQKSDPQKVLPDRSQVGMTQPFMRAYTDRLVQLCHKRGAHAIGGMSAFIPSKTDKIINENAFKKIQEDKTREVKDGFDGSWVAHPNMVKIAREVFENYLKGNNHQKHVLREDANITSSMLTDIEVQGGQITEAGVRNNVNVCIQYIYNWLLGSGAVGLHNLMEDAATAEISRGQLWQWIRWGKRTNSGIIIDKAFYRNLRDFEYNQLKNSLKNPIALLRAIEITDQIVLNDEFIEFLTLPSYEVLYNMNRPKI